MESDGGRLGVGLMIYTIGLKAAIQVFTESPPLPPEGASYDI